MFRCSIDLSTSLNKGILLGQRRVDLFQRIGIIFSLHERSMKPRFDSVRRDARPRLGD